MGYALYGVIGDGTVLGELRHPTMHPMVPLRLGLGLCPVRTELAKDEPPADVPGDLLYLTEPVLGYIEVLSERTRVIYVTAEFHDGEGGQAACGWSCRRMELGPLVSHHDGAPARGLLQWRRPTGAINDALAWLGIKCPRLKDQFAAVGLDRQHEWEP